MKKFFLDSFWILVTTAIVIFFTIAFVLAEFLKMIPVDIF